MPSSLSGYLSVPKTKSIFQMLWLLFEGHTNRARPSQPFFSEKLSKWHFLTHAWNSNLFFLAKLLLLKCCESVIYSFYPKYVSGSVQVIKKVDKLDYFKKQSKHLKNYFCFRLGKYRKCLFFACPGWPAYGLKCLCSRGQK